MLTTVRLRAAMTIEVAELSDALIDLDQNGSVPVGLGTDRFIAESLGLDPGEVKPGSVRIQQLRYSGLGDVFMVDGEIYYITARNDQTRRSGMVFDEPDDDVDSLEVGLITQHPGGADDRLRSFADRVVDSFRKVMDGRRFRHLSFDWSEPSGPSGRSAELRARLEAQGGAVRFSGPEYDEDSAAAVEKLAKSDLRQLLLEINSSGGFALEADIVSSRSGDAVPALQELVDAGLVQASHLVQCRKSSRPLTRIEDPAELAQGPAASLRCATCDRLFSEELMLQGYGSTTLGRGLTDGSHWMTIWVTKRLVALGVPMDQIMWNMEEASEEIDLVVEFLGELWIMELKDRDFDPRDAHSLNYRRVRYQPDQTLVITTGRVSTDAKRIFEDVANEERGGRSPQRGRRSNIIPQYLEGLDIVDIILAKLVDETARRSALVVAAAAAASAGINPRTLVSAIEGPAAE